MRACALRVSVIKREAAVGRKRKPGDQIGNTDAPVPTVAATTPSSPGAAGLESGGDPTAERVRQRAHQIYERRRALGLPGDAEGDWLKAEAELGSRAEPKP
jgi:hypothetical protein